MRKTDDRRKLARKRKAERKEEERRERDAELRRLKNLKRAELDERLATIQRVSGHAGAADLSAVLDGDFDPASYDAAMAAAFDGEYYEVRTFPQGMCMSLCVWAISVSCLDQSIREAMGTTVTLMRKLRSSCCSSTPSRLLKMPNQVGTSIWECLLLHAISALQTVCAYCCV